MSPLEEEILAEVLRIAGSHTDNEATAMPAWWIMTPRFGGASNTGAMLASVLGPFWSRKEAEDWLEQKRYRFSKRSTVYCGSLHDNPELRRLYELSRALGAERKAAENA